MAETKIEKVSDTKFKITETSDKVATTDLDQLVAGRASLQKQLDKLDDLISKVRALGVVTKEELAAAALVNGVISNP